MNIWGEPWLPDAQCPIVTSPICNGLENEKVSSLMVGMDSSWDLDILSDLFEARDRDQIVRIPLSTINREDC